MKRKLLLSFACCALFFSGCVKEAELKPQPMQAQTPKPIPPVVCSKLERPEYLSFKQAAFAVAKKEKLDVGDIVDLYFFDKKFKAENYKSLPFLKLDLESKHNSYVDIFNYATNNRKVDIVASDKDTSDWMKLAENKTIVVRKGLYTVADINNYLGKILKLDIAKEFLPINVNIAEERVRVSALDLLNKITKSISAIANYDFKFENNTLYILNSTPMLTVKELYIEPFVEMLQRQKIYYQKTENTFVIKDSIYSLWLSKMFVKTLNMSEDRFNFCTYMNGEEYYGSFTGNDRIVLKDIGKIQLVDYGMVYEGKLKYKLKIESKEKSLQEYTVYGDTDTFSTQVNENTLIKIKLF